MTTKPSPSPPDAPQRSTGPPTVSSRELFAGAREVVIQHGDDQYRLRLTSNNKLILVK
jgi:hemin uptake protein HemP